MRVHGASKFYFVEQFKVVCRVTPSSYNQFQAVTACLVNVLATLGEDVNCEHWNCNWLVMLV